jgi:hypothetical protein
LQIAGIKSPETIIEETEKEAAKESNMQQMMMALMQAMTAPRVATMSNGKTVTIQHAGVNNGT